MFKIDGNKTMYITRGDVAHLTVNFIPSYSGYVLGPDSFVRLSVYEANNLSNCIFHIDEYAGSTRNDIDITINPSDTRDNIAATNTPQTFWYEIEIDPGSEYYEQTPVGYDTLGPKLFIVYPEGIIDNE